jgi:hypothetical protein
MKVSGEVTKNIYSLHFLQEKKIAEIKKAKENMKAMMRKLKQTKTIDQLKNLMIDKKSPE